MLRGFGTAYVTLIRNTPLTLIVFFCAFGALHHRCSQARRRRTRPPRVTTTSAGACVGLAVYHAAFVAEALRSGINTVPQGQAEAARAIGLPFGPPLTQVVLPQAFRGAIAPLGNTLIALTKNTTVVATIGVAEASYLMRNMIEFNSSLLYAIFFIMATGFVILTLPMGVLFTRCRAGWRCGDERRASVLFDAPGPKARFRHRIIAVVGGLLIAVLLVLLIRAAWPANDQLTAAKWAPFLERSTWTAYLLPGLIGPPCWPPPSRSSWL